VKLLFSVTTLVIIKYLILIIRSALFIQNTPKPVRRPCRRPDPLGELKVLL